MILAKGYYYKDKGSPKGALTYILTMKGGYIRIVSMDRDYPFWLPKAMFLEHYSLYNP